MLWIFIFLNNSKNNCRIDLENTILKLSFNYDIQTEQIDLRAETTC